MESRTGEDALLERIETLENQLRLAEAFHGVGFWMLLDRIEELTLKDRQISCIVCGFRDDSGAFRMITDRCIFGGGALRRFECPECDAVFGPMKYLDLDDELIARDYALLYSRYSEGDSTANEISCFHCLEPEKAPAKKYLNWGTGGAWSRTMETLRGEGYDVWGYEPMLPRPSEFVACSKSEISAKFDGIFSNNVIEHFRQPVGEFTFLHGILNDGGTMVHQSPCYEYRYAFTRFHTLFLTGRSPHVLAERTGFSASPAPAGTDTLCYIFKKAP